MAAIDPLRSQKDEANKIVKQIIAKSKQLEKRLVESSELLKNISGNAGEAKKLNQTLSSLVQSTNKNIEKFREERKSITKSLAEVNSFYNSKYLPLSKKISDKTEGLQAKIALSKKASDEIVSIKASSTQQFNEVKKLASEFNQKAKELRLIDSNIRKLYDKTKENQQDSESIVRSLSKIETEINSASTAIQQLHKNSEETSAKINVLLNTSDTETDIIKENREKSNSYLNEITKIYNLAAQTGLSGEFERQKKRLGWQVTKWEILLGVTAIFLLCCIIYFFQWEIKNIHGGKITKDAFDIGFYTRFLMSSPVVYFLYFCARQHSQTKRLYDKYAFKTTLTMSIRNHIEMLLDEVRFGDGAQEKIVEFVLAAFQKIYTEPYTDRDLKLAVKFDKLEMQMDKTISEKLEQIKEHLSPKGKVLET